MRILVCEYAKAGGSWLTTMLADALQMPARDLYFDDTFSAYDLSTHPWYEGAKSWGLSESCVIKSHELPTTQLHGFPSHFLHLMRDGRDVVVSKYFFDKDFQVNNGISNSFSYTFEEFIQKTASEWANFVTAWSKVNVQNVKYETLLIDTVSTLKVIFDAFSIIVPEDQIVSAVHGNTKEKFKEKLSKTYTHNTFVRKGISGDWINYFTPEHKIIFKQYAGEALIAMGYELNMEW